MVAVAPHHRLYSQCWLLTYPLVWAIVLSVSKAMREASLKDKANIVPTPCFLFIAFFWELRGKQNLLVMKILRMIGMALFAVLMCVNFASCSNEDEVESQETDKIKVSLGCTGEIIDITQEPLTRTETTSGIYTILVFSDDMVYAEGTFSSVENLSIELIASKTYNFEVKYKPNSSDTPTDEFEYKTRRPSIESMMPYYEESDLYYGLYEGYTPTVDGEVEIYMRRMSFGIKATVNNLVEGAKVNVILQRGNVTKKLNMELTKAKPSDEKTFTLAYGDYDKTFSKIYKGLGTKDNYVNYYEEANLHIVLTRIDGKEVALLNEPIIIERNKRSCITINIGNSASGTSNDFSITQEKEGMVDGNTYEVEGEEGTIVDTTINKGTE